MNPPLAKRISRRQFVRSAASGTAAGLSWNVARAWGQTPGDRPVRAATVRVLNPQTRVPIGLIIDDSTCLVNLNRFAVPQFDVAFAGANATYQRDWRDWPLEIPDSFVRKFGEWCAANGVKGKYSIVPFPACVGRLDRMLPGWTQRELNESLELVRNLMVPNWDIHPEMVTHTRVIDVKTGHPVPEHSLKFMENWEWTTGRSAEEIAEYMAYALQILKNVGLPCEGITTPGGFGNRALPQLSRATLQAVRAVYGAEIPHYFRHLYDRGEESVAPRVEYASDLNTSDPRCVVSIIACTGDWTGGWDNTPPGGVDKFITADLKSGRMVDVIERGEPALMLAHWTGMHWNGQELGFKIFQEVVRRLHTKYDHLRWMKLSAVARYWAARELTTIEKRPQEITFQAPFACPDFTIGFEQPAGTRLQFQAGPGSGSAALKMVERPLKLSAGTFCREGTQWTVCFDLPKGKSRLEIPV
jgi:hypothetical protein